MTSAGRPGRDLELLRFLRGHEETDPLHLRRLREEILRDGHQRDPIVIVDKSNVILDGHHRAEIFSGLGLSKIAVHRVNYAEPDIAVFGWVPTFNVEPHTLREILGPGATSGSRGQQASDAALIWNQGTLHISADRHAIMNSVVGKFDIYYAKDVDEAGGMIRSGKAKAFLILPSVGKEDVIRSALSGRKLPPKTTRHVFPDRPASVFVSLEDLR